MSHASAASSAYAAKTFTSPHRCFLFSTGPNNDMGGKRTTKGHIDTPMVDCTVLLDNEVIMERGKFRDERLIVAPGWGG
jgi:hypothetical protein